MYTLCPSRSYWSCCGLGAFRSKGLHRNRTSHQPCWGFVSVWSCDADWNKQLWLISVCWQIYSLMITVRYLVIVRKAMLLGGGYAPSVAGMGFNLSIYCTTVLSFALGSAMLVFSATLAIVTDHGYKNSMICSRGCIEKFPTVFPTPMMTSSNGNIFRVTGHLCGKFTGHRWISHTKASDAELWCLLWSAPEWTVE